MLKPKYELLNEVIKPKGWLNEYLKRDASGITGNLDLMFEDAASDVFGKGKVEHLENNYWSSWWAGETKGNWMEAVVKLSFLTDDEKIIKKAEDFVKSVLENQSEDGYIGIYLPDHRYKITKRFGEFWTQSRVLRTLLAYYKGTKDEKVLNAMIRMADNIVVSLNNSDGTKKSLFEIPDEDGSKGHSLTIIDGLFELYKITKNKNYADFCVYIYEDYDSHKSKFLQDDIRTENLFNDNEDYIGHGPHTCEIMRLPLILYAMTENKKYLKIFIKAVEKLQNYMSISGSVKSDEFIGSFHQLYVKDEIDFKPLGCLPIPSVGYEYCSTTELVVDFQLAACLLGDFNFSKMQENALLNASMAAKQSDGKAIQYICCDNMYDASIEVGARYDYSPTHKDAAVCCAPNACRIMPIHIESSVLRQDGGFLVNMFMPAKAETSFNDSKVVIEQITDYPFNNTVDIIVKAEKKTDFKLSVRIPEYSKKTRFYMDEQEIFPEVKFGVATFNNAFLNNTLKIELDFSVKLVNAVDGTKAVKFGPLLYSLNVEAEAEKYYKYEKAEGFYDINYIPKKHVNWDYTLILNDKKELCYFKQISGEKGYLWENPTALEVLMLDRFSIPQKIKLLPIGATTLRRTTFPSVTDAKNRYAFLQADGKTLSHHVQGEN